MNELTLDDFSRVISDYPECERETIMKAYRMADILHKDQYRQSGEPLILYIL